MNAKINTAQFGNNKYVLLTKEVKKLLTYPVNNRRGGFQNLIRNARKSISD